MEMLITVYDEKLATNVRKAFDAFTSKVKSDDRLVIPMMALTANRNGYQKYGLSSSGYWDVYTDIGRTVVAVNHNGTSLLVAGDRHIIKAFKFYLGVWKEGQKCWIDFDYGQMVASIDWIGVSVPSRDPFCNK